MLRAMPMNSLYETSFERIQSNIDFSLFQLEIKYEPFSHYVS